MAPKKKIQITEIVNMNFYDGRFFLCYVNFYGCNNKWSSCLFPGYDGLEKQNWTLKM